MMKIAVLLKMAPDVVEELEIAASGKSLDFKSLRMAPNESDEHAVEEALLLKERFGAKVIVVALEAPEVDEALFGALANGADRAIKITGLRENLTTAEEADVFTRVVRGEIGAIPDLILTGVQAIDDLDGLIGPLIACELGLPFLGVVVGLSPCPDGAGMVALKECPGGVRAEFDVTPPAVLGIQAAERPPRYVPLAKLQAAAHTKKIELVPVPLPTDPVNPLIEVLRMRRRAPAARAEMLSGSVEEIAGRLCEVLAGQDLIEE